MRAMEELVSNISVCEYGLTFCTEFIYRTTCYVDFSGVNCWLLPLEVCTCMGYFADIATFPWGRGLGTPQ